MYSFAFMSESPHELIKITSFTLSLLRIVKPTLLIFSMGFTSTEVSYSVISSGVNSVLTVSKIFVLYFLVVSTSLNKPCLHYKYLDEPSILYNAYWSLKIQNLYAQIRFRWLPATRVLRLLASTSEFKVMQNCLNFSK